MYAVRFLLTFVLLNLSAPALQAQIPEAVPSLESRVDDVFSRWDSTNSPGCSLAVIERGEVVYKNAYGMANLDYDVPIRTDSVFHVASISKQFTAAAIALLAQEARLTLDDPIQDHLAEVPEFEQPITIRHLIHHTSGLRDQWSLLGLAGWRYSLDLITDEDVISMVTLQRDLNFPPGQRYLYSNTGYTLLGQIVEKATGKTLREFTEARIFEPLGMNRTFFRDNHRQIVRDQATGYRWNDSHNRFEVSVTNFDTVGATSLLTTVEDLARWDRNFLDPRVGGQSFLDMIHQRGKLNNGTDQDYAFGLVHGEYKGLKTVSHGGADAGYRAHFLRFPEAGFSFVGLCNLAQTNPSRLLRRVADIYLEGQLQEEAPSDGKEKQESLALDEAELSRILGVYWSQERAAAVQIEKEKEGPVVRLGRRTHPISYLGEGLFRVPEMEMMARFEPGPAGVLLFWEEGEEDDPETLERMASFGSGEVDLTEFAGIYRSREIETLYRIHLADGKLALHRLKRDPEELTPLASDLFAAANLGSLRFQRDETGQVEGFLLDTGRIRNFRFTKTEAQLEN